MDLLHFTIVCILRSDRINNTSRLTYLVLRSVISYYVVVNFCSLQSLANELKYRKGELYEHPFISRDGSRWRCSSEVVSAAWRLVQLCDEENFTDMRDLAGIFLAAVRILYLRCLKFNIFGTAQIPTRNRNV